jgi:hypothetical protein
VPEGNCVSTQELEFDPQLATDATGLTVNQFDRAAKTEPPSLVLRPAFQRNLVWNDTQKSFLVDSILRGLPVPELYIQTSTNAEGVERLVVVDGQQRISTCLHFLDGTFRLGSADDLDSRWSGKKFAELDDELKARFRGFKFIVRNLPAKADEGVLREIFRRLNRTVEALEAQELRHAAYTGRFLELVERAGAAEALEELGVFSPKDYLRRRNDEFVAEILLAVDASAFPNKKEGLDELFLTYERRGLDAERERDMAQRFGRAAKFIGLTAERLRKTRFRNKSDCYSLMTYLARNAEKLPLDVDAVDAVVESLTQFSSKVNALKRAEAQVGSDADAPSVPADDAVTSYLRAVERAASDRLSRVRRHESLDSILSAHLRGQSGDLMEAGDQVWPLAGQDVEEPSVDDSTEFASATAQRALLESGA